MCDFETGVTNKNSKREQAL